MRTLLGVAAAAVVLPLSAGAQVQVLDFEGIGDFVPIGNYYAGGAGPNYGVTFWGNANTLEQVGFFVTDPCRGSTTFPTPPSGCGTLFYYTGQTGANAGLNSAAGFTNGFSFFWYPKYATANDVTVDVYSGMNATGSLLASLTFPTPNWTQPASWQAAGLSFAGTAQSVLFTNAGGALIFDNVTLGSETPSVAPPSGGGEQPGTVTPEPASLALLGSGLGLLGIAARRRVHRRGPVLGV